MHAIGGFILFCFVFYGSLWLLAKMCGPCWWNKEADERERLIELSRKAAIEQRKRDRANPILFFSPPLAPNPQSPLAEAIRQATQSGMKVEVTETIERHIKIEPATNPTAKPTNRATYFPTAGNPRLQRPGTGADSAPWSRSGR